MHHTVRILAVEGDTLQAVQLQTHLSAQGFSVNLCADTEQALRFLEREPCDLVLLDVTSPPDEGLQTLQALRRLSGIPVLLIAGRLDEHGRIEGYSLGADDILSKPFSLTELEVRIQAILRRVIYAQSLHAEHTPAALVFDEVRSDVCHGVRWAELTSTEFRVLQLLWANSGQTLSKPYIYQQVFHRQYSAHDRSLDMHVSHIRRKLQQIEFIDCRLETVWSKGYQLVRLAKSCSADSLGA